MMPRYRFPSQGMPPHYYNPYGRPPMNPMRGMYPQMRQRGGILSKLLGKGARTGVNSRAMFGSPQLQAGGGGGSFLKTLTNPSSINGFLSNTQKILNTAQQVGPMVQQYGPIVKNLPSLWRLYRGLKDAPEFSNSETSSTDKKTTSINKKDFDSDQESEAKAEATNRTPLPSTPKLYI